MHCQSESSYVALTRVLSVLLTWVTKRCLDSILDIQCFMFKL